MNIHHPGLDLPSSLEWAMKQAYSQRITGSRHRATDVSVGPLHGFCFDNAIVLAELLENLPGYEPKIVCGATKRVAPFYTDDGLPDDVTVVRDLAGYVHFWVETEDYHLELSSESDPYYEEPLISASLPNDFTRLDDSYEYGADLWRDVRNQGHLCPFCSGHRHRCGCPASEQLD
jgi:hypothetical protein